MRVKWTDRDGMLFAYVGPCQLTLRPVEWYEDYAKHNRGAVLDDRAWNFRVIEYRDRLDFDARTVHIDDSFEVPRRDYDGGRAQAQAHAVAIAQSIAACKRVRRAREEISPEAVTWLADTILDVLQRSYADWRAYGKRLGRREPTWSTALIALELSQYGSRPDELRVADKRFYQLVYATLGRLARRKLITSSTGIDDRGRETRLWAPAA